jgi:hypothetical protein
MQKSTPSRTPRDLERMINNKTDQIELADILFFKISRFNQYFGLENIRKQRCKNYPKYLPEKSSRYDF